MSFRELRNFTEMMRALGYPRLISVENFRTPNFELVAHVLYWLVYRYDPSADLSDDIRTEEARVNFLKSVATIIAQKAHVKLSIKQLYKANGYAVKELIKVCQLLYDAIQTPVLDEVKVATDVPLTTKLEELKEARTLANDIVDSGSKLYSLLGREEELRKSRDRALGFLDSISLNLDSNDPQQLIERSIREQITIVQDNINELQKMSGDLEDDQKNLRTKIERKATELERAEKRLATLRQVRPAFMDEYEHMENELKSVYETYMERFRNLSYLESELTRYHNAEVEKKAESDRLLKRMQQRLREKELSMLRGDQEVDEANIDDGQVYDSGKDNDSEDDDKRPKAAAKSSGDARRPAVKRADSKSMAKKGNNGSESDGDDGSDGGAASDDDMAMSHAPSHAVNQSRPAASSSSAAVNNGSNGGAARTSASSSAMNGSSHNGAARTGKDNHNGGGNGAAAASHARSSVPSAAPLPAAASDDEEEDSPDDEGASGDDKKAASEPDDDDDNNDDGDDNAF